MPGPTLSATLEAKFDKLRQDFASAGDLAEQAVKKIEDTFKASNPQLGGIFSGGAGIAALLGGGAAAGLLKLITDANKEMADLEQNAKQVGLTIEQFQADRFATALKGLSNADFAKGVTELATKLNDATREENDLTKLLDA